MLFVHAPRQGAEKLASGVVVSRHEIGYRAPLHFRAQPIRVETWVRRIDVATFTLGYEVLDVSTDGERAVYAVASSVLVPYDLGSGHPRRVAAEERAVLETFVEADGPVAGRVV